MADQNFLAMVLKNLISQMTQNSDREDQEKTLKRIMREALQEKSASANQTEMLNTLMSMVTIKEKALDTKQQELENAASKEKELKAQVTKLNQQITRMKKESSAKGDSNSVEESMQTLVKMLVTPTSSKSNKKNKKVVSQVGAARPTEAEQSRGAYPKGPQPAWIPPITNAEPPQPKQYKNTNCFNPKKQNKFCNKDSFTGSAFHEQQTRQWQGDCPPDINSSRFDHGSPFNPRNASQNFDRGDAANFNQESCGKSNRGGFANSNHNGKWPGFGQHKNFSDTGNQKGFTPRIPAPVNQQSGKGNFQSEMQDQRKPVNLNYPKGYKDRKFEQGAPADSRDSSRFSYQNLSDFVQGPQGQAGFQGPQRQASFQGPQGQASFQGHQGDVQGTQGNFPRQHERFQRGGRFNQRGGHNNFNETKPQQNHNNSEAYHQLPCDTTNNNQDCFGAVPTGSHFHNQQNSQNSRNPQNVGSENSSDSHDADIDSKSESQTRTLDSNVTTWSASPNSVPALSTVADRKWLDKEENSKQMHKMAPEGQEGGSSAAAEASVVSLFVGTGIPSEEEAKAKKINMNQSVKDIILIAKTGDGVINSTPKTLGDMVQFKKNYPNATAIVVK